MENQWSKELIEYTRNHFGDLGTTRLKNLKPGGKDSEINQGEAEYQALKAYISSHSIPIDDGQLTDIC